MTGSALCEPIAITGMACRLPGAPSLAAFWSLLREGRHAIVPVPPQRWDADAVYDADPKAAGKTNSRCGGFLDDIERFDASFFGISPREAAQLDPQQRILLELAYEAIEDAGIAPSSLAGSDTSVFIGAMTNDYFRQQLADAYRRIDVHTGSGAGLCMLANRLSYQFDLRGPSAAVDTACSSSLVAVFQACQSLWTGQARLALAGGVNVMLDPGLNVFYAKAGLSAPDGRCKTFSASANGIGRGEGGALVVLKRLADARADGDPVYAVIRGGAVNHDGRSNGMTQPNRWAQEQLLRSAFAHAGIDARELEYVELHGTGTLIGDPIEANALGAALAADGERELACRVGSVKTNLGHLEAAAGIAGLVKLALSIWHGALPPSLWFDAPNPHIPFDAHRLQLNAALAPWPGADARRLGGVSSFGLGGTNAHVVLEAAAAAPATALSEPLPAAATHALLLSARSEPALRELAARYAARIEGTDAQELGALCSAALARKGVHEQRLVVLGGDAGALAEALAAFAAGREHCALARGRFRPAPRPLALALPQQLQLERGEWLRCALAGPAAREAWEACRTALAAHGAASLPPAGAALQGAPLAAGDAEFGAWHFAGQYALLMQLLAGLPRVDVILADGLGQLAALCAVGGLPLAAAARWLGAGLRAAFVREAQLPEPQYALACDFDCGRAPQLEQLEWEAPQRPWHERLAQAAGGGALDLIALEFGEIPAAAEGAGLKLALRAGSDAPQRLFAQLALALPLRWRAWAEPTASVRLPAYPWQREPHWIARTAAPAAAPAASAAAPVPALVEGESAVLGARVAGPGMVWEQELGAARFAYARDHRVQGARVLPGAAYAELGLALQRALARQPWCALRDLELSRALLLAEPESRRLRVSYDSERAEYRVHSVCARSGAAELHARGVLVLQAPSSAAGVDLAALRARCTRAVPADAHYAAARARGLDYGPRFRGVQSAWLSECGSEVLARIADAAALGLDADGPLHPALLDACLQALLIPLGARGDAQLYVPTAVRELALRAALPPGGLWCHGQLRASAAGALEGDLALFDERGELLLEARGVRARALGTGASAGAPVDEIDAWLYESIWEPTPPAPASGGPARWLVFADRGGSAEPLLARLRAGAARELCVVRPGAQFAALAAGELCARPGSAADLERVLQHADARAAERIAYLWALDASADGAGALAPELLGAVQLLQALPRTAAPAAARLTLVTRQAQVLPQDIPGEGAVQAALLGLARVALHECPALQLRAVDLGVDPRSEAALADELLGGGSEDEVALRGERRWARRLARSSAAALRGRARPQPLAAALFRADASYLITGGFGGFGAAVAEWMVAAGARQLVLTSRRGGATPGAAELLERLHRRGARVLALAADIASERDVRELFAQIAAQLPPLRGVFHAAAELGDGPLAQLAAADLERAAGAKLRGAWLLHRHSEKLELDHFALFSSFAGLAGNPGQAAYAMACAALDALAAQRRLRGLPAIAIQWGALADAGMAAGAAAERLRRRGAGSFAPAQAAALLGRALELGPAQLALAQIDWSALARALPRSASAWSLRELAGGAAAQAAAPAAPAHAVSGLLVLDPQARSEAILPVLAAQLAETLQLPVDELETDVSLLRLGVDSLMALDLQAAVEKRYGVKLSTLELMKGASLAEVAQQIGAQLGAPQDAAKSSPAPAAPAALLPGDLDDVEELIARVGELSESEVDQWLAALAAQQEGER